MAKYSTPTALLQAFQQGYTDRNTAKLDEFMTMFTEDAELIGTNGQRPGIVEWYPNRQSARELVVGDWESWGDLVLELTSARIEVNGNTAWCSCPCTVTQKIGQENYATYLDFVKLFIETSPLPPEEKLHFILRGGANTVYELNRGETFIWVLRITAVMVKTNDIWQFAQVHFSFPTVYFPDVRIID